ncbi:MAG: hypothetical protein AAF921_09815 [Cyanobacteria bacterium P01_D01_bin.44]
MSTSIAQSHLWVAQTASPEPIAITPSNVWLYTSGGLGTLLIVLGIVSQVQFSRVRKKLKFEIYKNQELQKRVKLALKTIGKMERNPDLIHSRDFNLDYLRMRMEEEHFHFSVVNQLKVKVKQQLSIALRPQQAQQGVIGLSSKPRLVDKTFDVEYATGDNPNGKKRVLFRIQIKLTKLPTQPTSVIVGELINCIENYLSPEREEQFWQPTLLGRLATMQWDQKAKPTPLLVLEQTSEGVNVTFRSTNRRVAF